MHTAKLIRAEIFSCAAEFDGSFNDLSQSKSVPPTLLTLVTLEFEDLQFRKLKIVNKLW